MLDMAQDAAVAIWVPHECDTLPWRSMKAVADRLAAAQPRNLVAIRGVCSDGSTVFDLMEVSNQISSTVSPIVICCEPKSSFGVWSSIAPKFVPASSR